MSRIPNYIEISSNFVWISLHSSKYIQIQHDPSIFKYNIIQPSQGIFRSSFYHLSLSKFFCQSNVLFYPSTTGTHLLPRLVDSTHCPCALARIFAARWWGVKWWEWWGCVLIALILWSHKGWFFMLCWVWNRRSEIFPQFPDPKPHSQQSTSGTSPKLRPRNLPQITPSSWGTLGWCFYYQISVLEIPHLLSSTIEAKIAGFRNKPHLLCLG